MSKVAVVTDSTAYIPKELLNGHPIRVAPLQVIWNQESFRDGVDIMPEQFYQRLAVDVVMPSTSQTPPADFQVIYEDLLNQGYEILSVHISSKLSGTLDSALQARQAIGNAPIEIVDSLSAGMGLGFTALEAARAALKGESLSTCKAIAEHAIPNTGVLFTPDTLEFLRRGGRIGNSTAFIGKMLDLKPIMALHDGVIVAVAKTRTRGKAIDRMVDLMVEEIGDRRPVHLASLHANAPELASKLIEKACARFNSKDIIEAFYTDVSPAIGTHLGPAGLGIAYLVGE